MAGMVGFITYQGINNGIGKTQPFIAQQLRAENNFLFNLSLLKVRVLLLLQISVTFANPSV